MAAKTRQISVSAPGRICLFGEHQDYLKLPVIAAAINLRIWLTGEPQNDVKFHIHLPDIDSEEILIPPKKNAEFHYERESDYFRSVYNVLKRVGIEFEKGYDCTVQGDIPINSGTGSSSALTVAWTKFLIEASGNPEKKFKDPEYIARLAYLAEVEEFGEPGGMMDQYTAAVGGIIYIDFADHTKTKPMANRLGPFVLGDSGEAKDTKEMLSRVKLGVLGATERIKKENQDFDLRTVSSRSLEQYRQITGAAQFEVLRGACLNRDITQTAKSQFEKEEFNHQKFGRLLSEHQEMLDKLLRVSTPKINLMLDEAIEAGAYGGKINGSGGGGCMFVYAPENTKGIAEAIERAGGKAYIVRVDEGLESELRSE